MTVIAVGCVALAAVLLVRPPAARRAWGAWRAQAGRSAMPHRRRWGWAALAAVGLLAMPAAGALVGGGRTAVLGATAAIVAAATGFLADQHRRRRRALTARVEVARACAALAGELRVGRVPSAALISAAADCPVLQPAAELQAIGGQVTDAWTIQAQAPGFAGLAELARAWRVAVRIGAPLAPALEQVAEALSADQAVRRVVNGELAAPRATGKIMAVLPAGGIGIGYLLGGDPIAFLLGGPIGWACLLAGTALAAAGVTWIEMLARQAAERG